MFRLRSPGLGLALGLAIAPPAAAFELRFPVDCDLGRTCFLQNFVDRDPGPGARDFTCGPMSYDGHKGTDIRLADRATMRAGVTVRAAAAGTVTGRRDGMADIARGEPGAPALDGRDCGNGLMIRHDSGWSVQYCHLARGSLRLGVGDRVTAGAPIGEIGLSGATEFPHLHLTLRDPQGRVIDPFDAREQGESCRFPERETLWAKPAPAYSAGGALAAGMAPGVPDYLEVREGTAGHAALSPDAPALVFWAHFYGLRAGDVIETRLADPSGRRVAADRHAMDRDRATQYRAIGLRNRGALARGTWRGEARLLRGGAVHDRISAEVRVGGE